jgi:two-component system chemotaxis response regulator CheY
MSTVLIVDDETVILEMLRDLLEDAGYRVVTARDGRDGLAAMAAAPVDVVLCDVMMPVMDGVAFCRAVQADAALASTPVLLMSAGARPTEDSGCRSAGFLQKPFTLDVVLAALAAVLGAR